MDVARELAAHRDFCPFDPIDPGIATGTAAFDRDFETWNKAQVHQMLGDRMVQLQFSDDGALADLEVGQSAGFRDCVAASARI